MPRATAKPVADALVEALKRYGTPKQILTDNGKVFTGKRLNHPSNLAFDRICQNNGIKHILTAPYSPTTTGKIERLHRTMRKEFFDLARYETIEETQVALDAWVEHYNTQREHQSIGDVPPLRRFELRPSDTALVVDTEVAIEPQVVMPSPREVHTGGCNKMAE